FVAKTKAIIRGLPYPDGIDASTLRAMAKAFAAAKRGVIIVGQDLLQAPGGYQAMMNLTDFLLLLGKLTQPGWGIAPLTEENNEQGAVDMGATAGYLPGAAGLQDGAAGERLLATWKGSVPPTDGMR